jgi:hypothetical protein
MQWEYMTIDLTELHPRCNDAALLNEAGAMGWELVGISVKNVAYLKRLLGKPSNRTKPVS